MQMLSKRYITYLFTWVLISAWQMPTDAGCTSSGHVSHLKNYQNKNTSNEKVNVVGIYHNRSIIEWHCGNQFQQVYVCFLKYTRRDDYWAPEKKIACLDFHHLKDNSSEFEQIELNSTTLEISGFSSSVKQQTYLIDCSSGMLNDHSTEHVRYQIVFKDIECSDRNLQGDKISNNNRTNNGSLKYTDETGKQPGGPDLMRNQTEDKISNNNRTSNGSLKYTNGTGKQPGGPDLMRNQTVKIINNKTRNCTNRTGEQLNDPMCNKTNVPDSPQGDNTLVIVLPVVLVVVVLLIGGTIIFIVWRKRRRERKKSAQKVSYDVEEQNSLVITDNEHGGSS